MYNRGKAILWLSLLSLALGISAAEPAEKPKFHINDAHLHFVDFLQNTEGIEVLLERMDQAYVDHQVIHGLPVTKKWNAVDPMKPRYYLDDDSRAYWYSASDIIVARAFLSLDTETRKRFHPFMCGFNAADRNAIDHVKRMMEWHPDLWEGIGEIFTRHDDLTALTYGEHARANHIALDPIYELAGHHDMPVTMHSDISSVGVGEPLYMHEMEGALQKHPDTRFVWAHVGISRRVKIDDLLSEVRRLLKTYPNLWFDLSWVVYPQEVAPDGIVKQEWVELIEEFPDRFMIGTDKIGHFDTYVETIRSYDALLEKLTPDTARLVATENFLSVLPKRVREKLER